MRGSFREAAEIQRSLLADEPPVFPGFDVACRSVATEEVGGDFYDFHGLGDDILGFAIGDASGHGLPAALVVRDVVTGLRMGIEKDLKIAHVFAKLNRVIHRSRLSSRFVSVFYGELEADGNLVYVNAGHPPPILFFRHPQPGQPGDQELSVGGTVVGPLPEVRFRRGFARLRPGRGAGPGHRRDPRAAGPRGGVLRRRAAEGPGARPAARRALARSSIGSSRRPPTTGTAVRGTTTPPRWWSGGRRGSTRPADAQEASASSSATRASMLATGV